MYTIIEGRDTGKTRKLLMECANNDGIIICKHPDRIVAKCIAYGLPIVQAMGYDEVTKHLDTNRKYYIDELEEFVKYVIPTLEGYNLTVED